MIIEKNIPVPGFNSVMLETMSIMEVGDSFLVGNPSKYSRMYFQRLKTNEAFADKKFITRTVDGGMRVWRSK